MQLTEAPEGKSSLQQQLNEAEKRAQEAEVSAQDAQATLARTLLDAARVEAVVTARIKAQSEAEIEALRAELDALKHAGTTRGAAPGDVRVSADAVADDGDRREAEPLAEPTHQPLLVPEHVPVSTPQDAGYGSVTLKEWDRPFEDDETPRMRQAAAFVPTPQWEVPTPARVALLLAVAVAGVITSYTMTASWLDDRGAAPSVTAMAGAVAGLVRADARSTASVSASVVSTPDANWLLYMPVERTSLVRYLAGNAWPTIQLAEKR
jgi:hypothetical protein